MVRKHTDNLEAYDYLLRGVESSFRYTQETNIQARQMFEKAVALDPRYAEAYVWLGWTYYLELTFSLEYGSPEPRAGRYVGAKGHCPRRLPAESLFALG